jgi:hypothetical protein
LLVILSRKNKYKDIYMLINLKDVLFTVIITIALSIPLMAQTDKENDDLKKEVQALREEVKILNNSIPFRGDPNWGTGFMTGFKFCGMFGTRPIYGYELGYSWSPRWLVRCELDYYPDSLNPNDSDKENIAYAAGIIAKTPLSINLRGYAGVFIGGAKPVDYKTTAFWKALIGFEFYTNRHVGLFIEVGNAIPFSDDPAYTEFYRGFAVGGIRIYF